MQRKTPVAEADKWFQRPGAAFAPVRTANQAYRRPSGARPGLFPATHGPSQARNPVPAGKMVAVSAKSPTLGSTRVDSAPSTRRALEDIMD